MHSVETHFTASGALPGSGVLLAVATGRMLAVIVGVVAAAVVAVVVGATLVARRRRSSVDADLADARIAALWAGTHDEPAPPDEPTTSTTSTTSTTMLAMTVWRLPPNQVLGLVLDALGDHGFEPVEVAGDQAVLTDGTTEAVVTYTPAVAIDATGHGLHVQIELSGPGVPALADALPRRLVAGSPPGGPVALVQDPSVRARAGAPRR